MAPRPTDQSSVRPRPTLTAEAFALSGPSDLPDPALHAYRKDLADVALTGRVIASHYAEPLERTVTATTVLRLGPASDADVICDLRAGAPFAMLDDSLGWAWGYAGEVKRVGYVPSEALGA